MLQFPSIVICTCSSVYDFIAVNALRVFVAVFAVQKEEVQKIEHVNADYCLQIQELEHCICTRDSPSSHLDHT